MKRIAATEVKSSMMLVNDRLLTWKEVMTMRQNPKRLAEVVKMCWEVLFAICSVLCFWAILISVTKEQPSIYDKTTALHFLLPIHKTVQ